MNNELSRYTHKDLSLNEKSYSTAYVRFSAYKQLENNSIQIQLDAIRHKAKKLNLTIKDEAVFIDKATSAYKKSADERVELNNLKRYIISNHIENLIVYDTSRMDRSIYEFVINFYRVIKKKIPNFKVYDTTQDKAWDPEDLSVKIKLLLAHQESQEKRRRASDSQVMLINQNKRPGSTVPFGYRHEAKTLVVDQDQANVVNFIYYLSAWGYSMDEIAYVLNESEVPTIRSTYWHKSTIENILKNEIYLGTLQWTVALANRTFLMDGSHEAIVSPSLYYFYQKSLALKEEIKLMNTPYLINDLLICATCKEKMSAINQSTRKPNGKLYEYRYYKCMKCKYKISVEPIHKAVLLQCEIHLKQMANSQSQFLLKYIDNSLKDMELLLIENEKELTKRNFQLKEIKESSKNDEVEFQLAYEKVISDLEEKKTQIQSKIDSLIGLKNDDSSSYLFENLLDYSISNLPLQELKMMLHMLVKQISYTHDINRKDISITFNFNPFVE